MLDKGFQAHTLDSYLTSDPIRVVRDLVVKLTGQQPQQDQVQALLLGKLSEVIIPQDVPVELDPRRTAILVVLKL